MFVRCNGLVDWVSKLVQLAKTLLNRDSLISLHYFNYMKLVKNQN